ncbi:MAG TPA: hypothetical protein VFV50_04245, partial [Bdellovibrionales bacterium]|nr:hypothetical protein [Bdellovibrionales bacterium]
MSLNQVVRSVLSASVLLFGLTSCSSDEAEVRRDEWEEPELVVLRNEDGGARTEISIKDRLDIGDSLTFRFSEPETLSSIRRLDVRALCTGLEETDDEGQWVTYTQENRQEFRLADLMPEALLGSLESEFICQLTVKITNAIGSTKTFDIPRVLAGREREDKLQIEFGFDRRLTPATLEPAQFKDIWVSGPQMRAGTASAHCTRLTQSLQVNDLSQIRLSDLLLQTVKEEKNSIDPRKQYPVQRCKIVFRDSTPIKATAVSRDFVVDFGPVKLFAQARAIADFPHSFLSGEASPVARVFVDNPHPFPVTMKVPVEAALGVAEAVYRTNFPLVQGSIGLGTAPGRFVFSTGPAQEDRLVTIKPRSSV